MPQVKQAERSSLADDPSGRAVIRAEHLGRWLAWSADGTRLVAAGETFEEVRAAAARAGAPDAILDWVEPGDGRQVTGLG